MATAHRAGGHIDRGDGKGWVIDPDVLSLEEIREVEAEPSPEPAPEASADKPAPRKRPAKKAAAKRSSAKE